MPRTSGLALGLLLSLPTIASADTVIPDDLIVQSSECIGANCVNNESFGFDTVRLKADNLRLKFEDTSTSVGFPSNDWEITINDLDGTPNALSYFAVTDVNNSNTQIFKLMAGAPANSLYLGANGKLGLRTGTPVLDVHMLTGDTPAIRFEQTTSPFIWDMAGNEANFFIRDITNGSRLPFRVRPGAPTSSLDVAVTGFVGVGTASPGAPLHIMRNDGNAQLRIEEASAANTSRTLLSLINNGPATLQFTTATNTGWNMTANSALTLATQGAGTPQFSLAANGNLAITGTLSTGSSRTLKTAIIPVDGKALLDKLMSLTIYQWKYRASPAQEQHVGPMAEDFHAAFQLGSDPKSLAPSDVAGITLGAVQALAAKVKQRDADIVAIRARISALEARVAEHQRAAQ